MSQVFTYDNRNGNSNVSSYELIRGGIAVTFKDGSRYTYTNTSTGRADVERMIQLAGLGVGLNAYINRVVKHRYARKG